MRVSAPRVRDVLEGDKVGAREDDSIRPEGVNRFLARQVRLKGGRRNNRLVGLLACLPSSPILLKHS